MEEKRTMKCNNIGKMVELTRMPATKVGTNSDTARIPATPWQCISRFTNECQDIACEYYHPKPE